MVMRIELSNVSLLFLVVLFMMVFQVNDPIPAIAPVGKLVVLLTP
jgi:hypothetical protein